MSLPSSLSILEVVQSLEKGGRTKRFCDTVNGLKKRNVQVTVLSFSKPLISINLTNLKIIEKKNGFNWYLIKKIRQLIKNNKINIIHAHCELSQLYSGIAAIGTKTKVVGTFHRSDLAKYQPSKLNSFIKILLNKYVAVSYNRLSLLIEKLTIAKQHCHVIHGSTQLPFLECNQEQIKNKLHIPLNYYVLLSIGHLGYIKGHQDTISALRTLIDKYPDLHLYIAGDGSEKEKLVLTNLISKNKLNQYITFLGEIDNVEQWLSVCDIFVQPSVEEAFGLVFIEAGAHKKTVIATSVGGIEEIVIDGETGLLVPPESPEALANALTKIIKSPTLNKKLGEQAYQRIVNYFTIDNMINKYLIIFEELKTGKG